MTAASESRAAGRSVARDRWATAALLLRWWVGAVWLSNGIAKLVHVRHVDLGFFRGSLIDLDVAHGILTGAARSTPILPLHLIYGWVAGAAWPLFGGLLTAAELLIGTALLTGIGPRIAAVAGILILGPVWVMKWSSGGYLWDYPADLAPLLVIVVLPRTPSILHARGRTPTASRPR